MIGGDIARGWDLARSDPEQSAQVAVSVLVDRLIGMVAFLTTAVAGLAYAVVGLGRTELSWLLTTTAAILAAFVMVFSALSLAMQVIIYLASLPGAVLWWRRRETRR